MNTLSRDQIVYYLGELSSELAHHGIKGELLLFGGAAMVLAFNARVSTKDVDAIFRPKQDIYKIAMAMAA